MDTHGAETYRIVVDGKRVGGVILHTNNETNINELDTLVTIATQRSVLPKATKRPVNPTDMNIVPPPESINTEVIMDGRILEENLNRLGLDINWLNKELKCQGYKNAKEIFLGICDDNKELTLFV